MKTKKNILTIIFIAIILLIGFIVRSKFSLLGRCGENNFLTSISQDKSYQLTFTRLNCGATTDYSTRITATDTKNNQAKVIGVLKGDHQEDIKIEWLDSTKVSIKFMGSKEDIFNEESKFNNLDIVIFPSKN